MVYLVQVDPHRLRDSRAGKGKTMATIEQVMALLRLRSAAVASDHIWPNYAACEGVLESAWGTSQLYLKANNVFGQKQSSATTEYPSMTIPTREFIKSKAAPNGAFVTVNAIWVQFPTLAESFTSRMALLQMSAERYPNYATALHAETGAEFVTWVSKTWSTDPNRANLVLEIYEAHRDVLVG